LQRRGRERAGLGHAEELEREVTVDLGFFDHWTARLAKAPAPDGQLVGLDPQLLFARQAPVAAPVDIHARALEDGGDPDLLLAEDGVEAVDENFVLVQLDLAQASRAARPDLGRELELRTRAGRRAGLDREP
jgi:hypothetical protein